MVPEKEKSLNNLLIIWTANTMMNAAACNLFKLKEKIAHSRENSTNSANENGKREMSCASLPMIKPEIFLNDRSLVAVYCFIKNFIGWVKFDHNSQSSDKKKIL